MLDDKVISQQSSVISHQSSVVSHQSSKDNRDHTHANNSLS